MQLVLTPELIVEAYKQGLFPMAYHAQSPYVHWICPEIRGQLPIKTLHIPRRLEKTVRQYRLRVTINEAFSQVIHLCAEKIETRPETWINEPIIKAFEQLHAHGHAHSIECWSGEELIGGIYGLATGSVFFGESMFSRRRDASKIALVHLTARLWRGGFTLLDTQFVNNHLKQFGVFELPHSLYKMRLSDALQHKADFLLKDISDEKEIVESYFRMRGAPG